MNLHRICRRALHALLVLLFFTGCALADKALATRGRAHARVLFAGDSLMEKLGPQVAPVLEEHLKWSCLCAGKKSTGLCRPDFYNWPKVLEEHLEEFEPQLVVMWVGTNDNQGIHGVRTGGLLTPAWRKAYYHKMLEIARLCHKHGAKLIFIGPPTVGDAKVDAELKQISKLMATVCQHHQIPFLDVRPIFADSQGRYIQQARNRKGEMVELRTRDRVHITDAGNTAVMTKLYPLMNQVLFGSSGQRGGAATAPKASGIRGSR